ncbi:lysophospholipid transporter LplT [Roseateles sp.]|jgi:LPLT family lysophospholipid transporter-like MFS transporter|uniref:lysophospholipid transporter LplT n=1 Tax=Roseateles sp. TaxID=1971397 RepID=UPI0037C89617
MAQRAWRQHDCEHPLGEPADVPEAARPRLPRGFHTLIGTQFLSSLADNALLIVTIALLIERGEAPWLAPLLKFGFTLAYVLLAPFIGALADAVPKHRLMRWMNALKMLGLLALMLGLHPVAAFAIVGLGAAGYAPAKYGLLTELVKPQALVAANGWLEVSVVGAALAGAVLGGLLVAPFWLDSALSMGLLAALSGEALPLAATRYLPSLLLILGLYAAASALNLRVPDSGVRYARRSFRPMALLGDFATQQRTLWRDAEGGLSLAVTTVFWGLGATLQFAVLRWAEDRLGLPLAEATLLQVAVAVGVVLGACAAGRWVPLNQARRMLGFGVALGLLIPLIGLTHSVAAALPLLVLVGAVGGLLVVPMNALLQHRGHVLLSAGCSIAVQGFYENASVLAMLAVYALLLREGVSIVLLMSGFGGAIALGMAVLMWRERQAR